ncbi:MAG: hypothetical protein JNK45_13225 [Myxococcales bacterium]|nr:hypothetical protein [Myxococcales bacterium]
MLPPSVRAPLRVVLVLACGCGSDDDARQSGTAYTSVATVDPSTGDASQGDVGSSSSAAGSTGSAGSDASSVGTADPTASTGPDIDTSTGAVGTESSGGASVCDGVVGAELIPPASCDGPSGNTSTEIPANGLFSTSWFGCYYADDGSIVQDASDNCEFACGPQGLCDAGASGPECEAELRWFAADADRYGCGGRIRVTNCDNGNSVVLATLDRGPNCGVEMDCETPVLDMSHDAMVFLFDGEEHGGCDHATVVVEAVDEGTALGPG